LKSNLVFSNDSYEKSISSKFCTELSNHSKTLTISNKINFETILKISSDQEKLPTHIDKNEFIKFEYSLPDISDNEFQNKIQKDFPNYNKNINNLVYKSNKHDSLSKQSTQNSKAKLESRFKKIRKISLKSHSSLEKKFKITDNYEESGINNNEKKDIFRRLNAYEEDKIIDLKNLNIADNHFYNIKSKKIPKINNENFDKIEDNIKNLDITRKKKHKKNKRAQKNQNNDICLNCKEKFNYFTSNPIIFKKILSKNTSENPSYFGINNINNNIMLNNNFNLNEKNIFDNYKKQFFSEWKKNLVQNSYSFEIISHNNTNIEKVNLEKKNIDKVRIHDKINTHEDSGDKVKLDISNNPLTVNDLNEIKFKNSKKTNDFSKNIYFENNKLKAEDYNLLENIKIDNNQIKLKSEDLNTKEKSNVKVKNNKNLNLKNEKEIRDEFTNKKDESGLEKNKLQETIIEKQIMSKVNENTLIFIVVDDNLYIRNCLKNLLNLFFKNWKKNNPKEKINFEIIEGIDGIDVLKFVIDPNFSSKIKGIFIDENMEYLNGSEAIKIIRRLQKLNKISKLFQIATVTAFEDAITKNNILNAGVDEIYQKPIKKSHIDDFFKKYPIKENC